MNITENYPKYALSGRMDIHPCVLQDIGPSLWGRCPALTPLLQLITSSRESGTADHVRSLDDLLMLPSSLSVCVCVWAVGWARVWMGIIRPPVRNDIAAMRAMELNAVLVEAEVADY